MFPLQLQPLRGRRDDILPLAMRLLAALSPPGARIPALSGRCRASVLLTHAWPGNVRELENVMQRALVLCDGDQIERADIRAGAAGAMQLAAEPARRAGSSAAPPIAAA